MHGRLERRHEAIYKVMPEDFLFFGGGFEGNYDGEILEWPKLMVARGLMSRAT